jgi:hypothetical protein
MQCWVGSVNGNDEKTKKENKTKQNKKDMVRVIKIKN